MKVLAIDPGNVQSAYCLIDVETLRPLDFGILENHKMHKYLLLEGFNEAADVAIEMIASYGMPVGEDVFFTAVWIGRFIQDCAIYIGQEPALVKRMEEKLHICHSARARDSNIRHALIDRFAAHDKKNGRGTKKNPDWFYGFKKDIWAAYAVGITYIETRLGKEQNNDGKRTV